MFNGYYINLKRALVNFLRLVFFFARPSYLFCAIFSFFFFEFIRWLTLFCSVYGFAFVAVSVEKTKNADRWFRCQFISMHLWNFYFEYIEKCVALMPSIAIRWCSLIRHFDSFWAAIRIPTISNVTHFNTSSDSFSVETFIHK